MCDNISSEAVEATQKWVSLRAFPGYEASITGDIRKIRTGKLLKQSFAKGGLKVNIGKTTARVHDLVLTAWTGHPLTAGYRPQHLDGDKSCNHLVNLVWAGDQQHTRRT